MKIPLSTRTGTVVTNSSNQTFRNIAEICTVLRKNALMNQQLHCPKCKKTALTHAGGAFANTALPERALECEHCRGIWVPRGIIDAWRDHPFEEIEAGRMPSISPDDLRTGLCPWGHGILIRARVEADRVFHLERCGTCRGVWLDKGEWQRLASARFLDHLDDLWDPTWQKRHRAEHSREEIDLALRTQLGAELFNALSSAIEAVARHPARAQVLAWIHDRIK